MKQTILSLCLLSLSGIVFAQHQLVKKWETDSVFKVPESVLHDAANNVLYVANIEGTEPWGRDGRGSVGKLGTDGKVIEVEWVKGLNAPKGMALYQGSLYVADLNSIVVIDIASGKIARTITIDSAQGLNDVTIDRDGVVYVSDSRGKKVFRVENDRAELFLTGLKGPNGVLKHGRDFYILDAGTMYKLADDKSLVKIADGMEGGTDGIENVSGNDFIISCWAGVVYYVNGDGSKQLLLDTRPEKKNTADIGFDAKTKTVYVPTFWRNTVVAYEVK